MSQIEIILGQKKTLQDLINILNLWRYIQCNCSTCIESEKFYIPLQKITKKCM